MRENRGGVKVGGVWMSAIVLAVGVLFTAIAGRAQAPQAKALAAVGLIQTATSRPPTSCEKLSSLSLPNATITLTQSVPAGDFTLAANGRDQTFRVMPGFCRVAATLKPTKDSDIRMELWLPTATWNGKFRADGSAGNSINYVAGRPGDRRLGTVEGGMVGALRDGYATSSTDTGQTGTNGTFGLGNPEKIADYAYRAVHEMTINAKAIIKMFYGRSPLFSYFNGCSLGGGQGVLEAHRYPDDYDGIIAGAPGSPLSHGYSAWRLWLASTTLKDPSRSIPPRAFPMIHEGVLSACDALDGLKDGLIDDPRRCNLNPEVLMCRGTDTQACLTIAQVETVKRLLSAALNPRTQTLIFPPLEPGSELQWARYAGAQEAEAGAVDAFKYVFLKDPKWDWHTVDFDRDIARADEIIKTSETNTLEPDLRPFANRGGKLILFQGWSDVTNAPQSTVNYFHNAQKLMGEVTTSNTIRLFMGPGMAHCGGGDGPNTFDGFGALEQWVEKGTAPDRIIASHILRNTDGTDGDVDRTRPFCPYPQVARYNGTGSIDDAANFACKLP